MAQIKNKFENKKKRRSNKIELVFDEEKRREFLSGFHKRKLQRKKQAKEKLEQDLKAERKRLKAEAKESYKKLVVSHRQIPELEKFANAEEYEEDDVTVKIVNLSTSDIAKQNNWIGENQPIIKQESEDEEIKEESSTEEFDVNEIPGMELNSKKISIKKEKVDDDDDKPQFNNQRDIKKALKKQATKNMKKSKVFQTKNKLERQKQKKKSIQQKKQRCKFREKQLKKKR